MVTAVAPRAQGVTTGVTGEVGQEAQGSAHIAEEVAGKVMNSFIEPQHGVPVTWQRKDSATGTQYQGSTQFTLPNIVGPGQSVNPVQVNARNSQHRDYEPTRRLNLLSHQVNKAAKLLMNVQHHFAIDEITGSSWTYGPAGFFKRTPGKKTPQGFQALAGCSKMRETFHTTKGKVFTVGVVMCHALLWDLSGNAAMPKLDESLTDTANTVLRLVYMILPDGAENYDLFMDNRFAQPRLMVMLLAAFTLFTTCTILGSKFSKINATWSQSTSR